MRAEQWLMIAVGSLGAYAVYRLVTSKPSAPKPENMPLSTTPSSQPQRPALDLLQNIIGKHAPRIGTPYRGRLELLPGGTDRYPNTSNTREQIAAELQRLGFGNVAVYMNLTEAQSNDAIPLPDALANPTAGSRWFSAIWRGPARALPRELVLLWPTSYPEPGTGSWYVPVPWLGPQYFAG